MSERVQKLHQQAAKARRLAKSIPDDEASKKLLELAKEYEAMARGEEDVDDPKSTLG